jgi:hypothetical protein
MITLAAIWTNSATASPWPTGEYDTASTTVNQPTSISVLGNDTGDNLYISSVNTTSARWGAITISEDKQSLTYTPYKDFSGDDEFWYVLQDDQGRTNAAKVTVNVTTSGATADWPSAVTDTVETSYDTVTKIAVLDNDTGIGLKLSSVNEWSTNQGKAWISADNEISYQQYGEPRGEQQDEFWYVFEDQWGRKNSAKVVVTIKETPSSDAWPVANPETATATDGLRINIPALLNDTGNGLKITGSNEWTQNGGKTRVFDNFIRYTPPANYTGEDAFWYQIVDDQGRTNSTKIDLQVTENTEKSVVEFCGNTYETDGTLANTQITSLSPAAPVTYPSTEIPETGSDSELGTINGRRYYTETSGTEHTLMMEVNGAVSTVTSMNSVAPTYAFATYKGVIYFVHGGRYLLAHDGVKLTELGDLLLELGVGNYITYPSVPDNSEYINTVSRQEGAGDALHFSVTNSFRPTNGGIPSSRTTYWRISDDLDWKPVKVASVAPAIASGFSRTERATNFYYFNGLDYHFYYLSQGSNFFSYTLQIKQSDNAEVLQETSGSLEKFIEDRGRLFAITEYYTNAYLSTPYQSKLFVVNNGNDELVELATCDQ